MAFNPLHRSLGVATPDLSVQYYGVILSPVDPTSIAATGDVTLLLARLKAGDRSAEALLFDLVYQELHTIARRQARRERTDHTLAPTAIVHEAYLRLFGGQTPEWNDRTHFFGAATRVMRHLLVDYARRRKAAKNGGGAPRLAISEYLGSDGRDIERVLLVDQALSRLGERDPRQAKMYELRYLAGLQVEELAETFGLSNRTILRELRSATAWLRSEVMEGLSREAGEPGDR